MNQKLEPSTTTVVLHNYPLISIGIPTFNGEGKIEKAIQSILDQGYPNLEIIISDNSSTDNTMALCSEISRKNASVKYFRQLHNIGVMPNFEFVRARASGDFFMWMSDDDFFEPGIIHKYVSFLIDNPDYVLVSGDTTYWRDDKPIFRERDFTFAQQSGLLRVVNFYFKVIYGSIFYGLMRTAIARQIPLRNRIGDDWHFIAAVAFLGKIKNLDCVGYNKRSGGISKNFKSYRRTMGASSFAERFPHVQIALDAFRNVLYQSPVFARPCPTRMLLAVLSAASVLACYYGKLYPFILGGRIKRLIGLKTSADRAHSVSSPLEIVPGK